MTPSLNQAPEKRKKKRNNKPPATQSSHCNASSRKLISSNRQYTRRAGDVSPLNFPKQSQTRLSLATYFSPASCFIVARSSGDNTCGGSRRVSSLGISVSIPTGSVRNQMPGWISLSLDIRRANRSGPMTTMGTLRVRISDRRLASVVAIGQPADSASIRISSQFISPGANGFALDSVKMF